MPVLTRQCSRGFATQIVRGNFVMTTGLEDIMLIHQDYNIELIKLSMVVNIVVVGSPNIDIGTVADDDLFLDAFDLGTNAATKAEFTVGQGETTPFLVDALTAGEALVMSLETAATTGSITWTLEYRIKDEEAPFEKTTGQVA